MIKAICSGLVLLLSAIICNAQTNVLFGQVISQTQSGLTNISVTASLVRPVNRPLVSNDNVSTTTDTNGNFSFTNMLWGKFTLTIGDASQTTYTFYVGTNTIGSIPIAALITNSAALPPNPGTNYYTIAQINALLAGIGGGGSSLWSYGNGGFIYPNGTAGTNNGWINNGFIYPQ